MTDLSLDTKPNRTSTRRVTIAAGLGTFVEYYDFAVYAYLAPVVASLFFAESSEIVGLIAAFGVFASSYLVRPFGAMFFGPLGDKYGRRNVMAAVILLMAAATTILGLLPTYAQVGLLAPILLTVVRLVQGFALGGEFGGAMSYISECAPPHRRAFHLSMLTVAVASGMLAGVAMATGMTAALDQGALESWGWRIPFLLALPLGTIGVYLRVRLSDTPQFDEIKEEGTIEKAPLRASLTKDGRSILLTLGLLSIGTVGTYLSLVYAPSYLTTVHDYGRTTALLCGATGIIAKIIATPFLGHLTDRIGRRPVFGTAAVVLTVVVYPAFMLLGQQNAILAGVSLAVLGILAASCMVAAIPMLTELFATRTRYTGVSIGWNVASTLFGGFAPLIVTAMISATGNPSAPAFYAILAGSLSLVALLMVKESAGIALGDRSPARPGGQR